MQPDRRWIAAILAAAFCTLAVRADDAAKPETETAMHQILHGNFAWKVQAPVYAPARRDEDLVGMAPHHEMAEPGVDRPEVDVRIHRNPVEFSLGPGDEPIEAGGHGVAQLRHAVFYHEPAPRCG